MQKTKLLVLSVLAAVLLSSSVISLASAQDSIPPATPDPSASVDPEAADKADETQIIDDGNSTSPDVPVSSDDEILYTIQDENSTDNSGAEPYGEDAQIYATGAQDSSDNTLIVAAIGVILAVVVGSVIGVVYFRKQVAKAKN